MKKYLNTVKIPLIVLSCFLLIGLTWKLFNFPSQQELIPIIKFYFDTYGIILVFIAAILESAFIIGMYAPGGTIIFLGVILSGGNPYQAILVVLSVIAGFLIGFTIDFYIGKFGWYRLFLRFGFESALEKTKAKIQKYGLSVPWIGYHNPDLGSFLATSYGILRFSYKRFLLITVFPVIAWCIFWGVIAYLLGMEAFKVIGYKMLFVIIGIWIIARIVEVKLNERKVSL
jgi:membrane protein DedA with SNARE-associated domain